MNIPALYKLYLQCPVVTTDSRNCPEGSIFIALKGDTFNGNSFAKKALEQGCAFAVIDEEDYADPTDKRIIVVENGLTALQQLANYHRRELGTKVIGITGTNGKTTTKELIAAVLSKAYQVLYTEGNLNNHIGVPLTLLRLTARHDLAVIEMGANHPGEIKALAEIAEPDYGIITNVGKAHLEGFGSFEGVVRTKGELYNFLRTKEDSRVFVNAENPYLTGMTQKLSSILYGKGEQLYVNGKVDTCSPFLTLEWKAGKAGKLHRVRTHLIGEYNFENVLAAITLGQFFGVDPQKINQALEAYTPANNRSQLKETADNHLIIDAYNANPTSMMAALQNFHRMEANQKMLILGDMRELGSDSKKEHQKIADYLIECGFKQVVLVGEEFAKTCHPFKSYRDVAELIQSIKKEHPQGYYILIKGSNGIRLGQVVAYL